MSKELAKSLIPFFFPFEEAVYAKYYSVSSGKDKKLQVQKDDITFDSKNLETAKKILVFDVSVEDSADVILELVSNSKNSNWLGMLVFCDSKSTTKNILKKLSKYYVHFFGINPDYFLSVVPLYSPNRKNIEKYIFQMSGENSLVGKLKMFLKKVFINLNCSDSLYDSFVVSVLPREL